MKTTLTLITLTLGLLTCSAQSLITNNVSIVITDTDDAALRLAWRLNNNARTNGIAPYTVVTNAITYGAYQDSIGTDAFQRIAQIKASENETTILQMYRAANEADRARVARILSGLAN